MLGDGPHIRLRKSAVRHFVSKIGLKRRQKPQGRATLGLPKSGSLGHSFGQFLGALAAGRALGIDSTPTVFVNGVDLGFPQSFEEVQQVIEEELVRAGQ